jgi:predicted transcriptional regulator
MWENNLERKNNPLLERRGMNCSAIVPKPTAANLMTPFPTDQSIFPRGVSVQRGSDGRISANSLNSIYNTLVNTNRLTSTRRIIGELDQISTASRENLNQLVSAEAIQKENATLDSLKTEFCYNYRRYEDILTNLFDTIANSSAVGELSDAQKNLINTGIANARIINTRLNDLIQITNFITEKKVQETSTANTAINQLNQDISSTFGSLQNHKRMLESQHATAEIRKRMAEFSSEKNKSASNLLGLYGFLNLVALGLLFYIYRSE